MLTPEQIEFAAEYVRRWRNLPPDDLEGLRRQVIYAMRDSVLTRGIAGAVLRARAPVSGKVETACGRCGMKWPTAQDAWICYTQGEHRAPINEVR